MSTSRKQSIVARRKQLIDSWRKFAPELSIGGYTLAQFEVGTEVAIEVRQRLSDANTEIAGVKLEREQTDAQVRNILRGVTNALRGDPAFGDDCPFYRSLGYVAMSERKRPVRKTEAQAPPTANVA